jgi:hypothetical protein
VGICSQVFIRQWKNQSVPRAAAHSVGHYPVVELCCVRIGTIAQFSCERSSANVTRTARSIPDDLWAYIPAASSSLAHLRCRKATISCRGVRGVCERYSFWLPRIPSVFRQADFQHRSFQIKRGSGGRVLIVTSPLVMANSPDPLAAGSICWQSLRARAAQRYAG